MRITPKMQQLSEDGAAPFDIKWDSLMKKLEMKG
jgi:hypothetical protein